MKNPSENLMGEKVGGRWLWLSCFLGKRKDILWAPVGGGWFSGRNELFRGVEERFLCKALEEGFGAFCPPPLALLS